MCRGGIIFSLELNWKKFKKEDLGSIYKTNGKPLLKVKTKFGEERVVFIEEENGNYKLRSNCNLENNVLYISQDDIDEYAVIGEDQ